MINQGYVTPQIAPVTLSIQNTHHKSFTPFVLEKSQTDIILGRPWLIQHQPSLDWATREIINWGCNCNKINHVHSPCDKPDSMMINSTSIESPKENLSTSVPSCYASFSDVFNPIAAAKLPPHRPWDCAVDLIPGEPIPKGRIYSLSISEQTAMREYVEETLKQGYIRPSTSPAAASFFFVPKKDGGL